MIGLLAQVNRKLRGSILGGKPPDASKWGRHSDATSQQDSVPASPMLAAVSSSSNSPGLHAPSQMSDDPVLVASVTGRPPQLPKSASFMQRATEVPGSSRCATGALCCLLHQGALLG